MRVGMAVDVPTTLEQKATIRKIVLLLDEAALHAIKAGLWIQGHPASDFLGGITDQLVRVVKES